MAGPDERAELLGETPERARHRTQRGRVAVGLVCLFLALAGVFSVAAATEPRSALLGNRNSVRRETGGDLAGRAAVGTPRVATHRRARHRGHREAQDNGEKVENVRENVENVTAEGGKASEDVLGDAGAKTSADETPARLVSGAAPGDVAPDAPDTAVSLDFVRGAIEAVRKQRSAAMKQAKEAGVPVDDTYTKNIPSSPRALETDVYAIVLDGADPAKLRSSDAEKKVDVVGHLGEAFGAESVAARAHLTPAVVAAAWPEGEALPRYALKEIRRLVSARVGEEKKGGDAETEAAMRALPWVDHFTRRAEDGSLVRDESWPENFDHHVGCLFAHMLVWQLAKDAQEAFAESPSSGTTGVGGGAFVFESDGASSANLAVPFSSLQFAADAAPADFDVLFVNKLEDPSLDTRFPWRSDRVHVAVDETTGATIDFFRYRNSFAAGISGYVIAPSFLEKAHARIAASGADMVDAWLYKLCGDAVSETDDDATFLRCYAAVDRTIVEKYREEHPDGP